MNKFKGKQIKESNKWWELKKKKIKQKYNERETKMKLGRIKEEDRYLVKPNWKRKNEGSEKGSKKNS